MSYVLSIMILLFEIGIFVRVSSIFLKKDKVSEATIRNISTFFAIFLFILSLTLTFTPAFCIFVGLIPIILLFIYKNKNFKHRKLFRNQELQFVRSLILQISSGSSVIDAIEKELKKLDPLFSTQIQCFVTFRQHFQAIKTSSLLIELEILLNNLINNPVNATEKLKSYENKLQIEHDFRHRSGQALLGVKIQAAIMLLIYICAFIYTITFYDFSKNQQIILISLTLFLTGFVWILLLGKKIKWKV